MFRSFVKLILLLDQVVDVTIYLKCATYSLNDKSLDIIKVINLSQSSSVEVISFSKKLFPLA